MGGICAVVGDGAADVVSDMCKYLKHRGPDDEGVYSPSKNVALGHRALYLANSPREHQPLSNEDGTIWVTFDGEIYNFEQLKKKLENHTFRSSSSAELLIHAYEEEDLDCLREINGDFAFCLWDSKKGRMFSARDKAGIKPLYYFNNADSGHFLASSEIKAVFADPLIPRAPNRQIIHEYLLNGIRAHTGDTFFDGVKELLPAHYILLEKEEFRVQKYWSPVQPLTSDFAKDKKNSDYTARFVDLFRDALTIRIPNNPVVGTYLSGGLDSTAVSCLMEAVLKSDSSRKGNTHQELFSAVYPNTEADETPYGIEVARSINKEINFLYPSVLGQWEDIKKFVYYMDEPTPVFSYYVYWCLARIASKKVRVTFSGQGPDEILGGHEEERVTYYKELWRRKKLGYLFMEFLGTLPQHKIYNTFSDVDVKRLLNLNGNSKSTIDKLFTRDSFTAIAPTKKQIRNESLDEFLLNETTRTILVDHLQFGDHAASAFSIETRYPFLDHRILEFVFQLPESQKIKNGWTKYILRVAMKGIIPEAIRKRRRKLGTPTPLKWFTDLEREIRMTFNSEKFRERGYFNQPLVLRMFDSFCLGKMNSFEKNFYAAVFWRILNLELWFESFFDLPEQSPGQS